MIDIIRVSFPSITYFIYELLLRDCLRYSAIINLVLFNFFQGKLTLGFVVIGNYRYFDFIVFLCF